MKMKWKSEMQLVFLFFIFCVVIEIPKLSFTFSFVVQGTFFLFDSFLHCPLAQFMDWLELTIQGEMRKNIFIGTENNWIVTMTEQFCSFCL